MLFQDFSEELLGDNSGEFSLPLEKDLIPNLYSRGDLEKELKKRSSFQGDQATSSSYMQEFERVFHGIYFSCNLIELFMDFTFMSS